MSVVPPDSPDCAAVVDDTESSTWVDSFSRLNYYLSDSIMILCYRLIDIVVLSLGLYYGTGVCGISNPLAVVSICLLAFDGIDLSIILVFMIRKFIARNRTTPDKRSIEAARGICIFFLSFKLVTSCVGTGYAFKPAASMNPDCELIRFCLGIVCYSSLIKVFMPMYGPKLPVRRSSIMEYSTIVLNLLFNGVYVGVILYGAIKTNDSACMYTNIEDFYFRAPLQMFAYIGVVLISCKMVIRVLRTFIESLYFRFRTWKTAIIRLLGVHYVLSYFVIFATLYYFSVGAVLLFPASFRWFCRQVEPSLYKRLLVWQWIYTLWPLITFPLIVLLICLGVCCGALLAAYLPASVSAPLLEMLLEMLPEGLQNAYASNEQNALASNEQNALASNEQNALASNEQNALASNEQNAPATQSTIEALPVGVLEQESNQFNLTECAICQAGFEPNEQVKRLQCGHFFHGTCVATWLAMTRICPVCRQRIPARNRQKRYLTL